VKAPAGFSDRVAGGEAVVEHLSAFGIEAELVERDTGTCRDTDYGNGEFDVAMQGWADYDHSYPYFHVDWIVRSGDATDSGTSPPSGKRRRCPTPRGPPEPGTRRAFWRSYRARASSDLNAGPRPRVRAAETRPRYANPASRSRSATTWT